MVMLLLSFSGAGVNHNVATQLRGISTYRAGRTVHAGTFFMNEMFKKISVEPGER